ncbi:MAG: alpha/beta hydrolase [Actinobacteria bacterium]|nr:MAG: alpha/beta hydrolase [Actinomycetota bacterium]
MATLAEEYLETDAGKVQLFRGGDGQPLLYLHSAAGEAVNPTAEQLADNFAVVAPVFPGFGESEGIDRIEDMEDATFHHLDLLDRLGFDSVPVVGLSLGGWMAAELATRYPERVSKMVLVNPVGLYIDGQPVKEIFGRTPAELAEDMFADQSHPMAQMMHMLSEFRGDVGQQIEVPMELVLPIWKSMSATAKLGWDPYLHNPKLRKRLHRVSAPTLVIHGAQDTLAPKAISEAYAADIPDARLVDVDGGAHLVTLEKPDEVAALIREFVS